MGSEGRRLGTMDVELRREDDGVYNDDDDDVSEEEDKTTWLQSLIHLVKGYIGPGCLSLPWAFSQLGLVQGTIACCFLCYWSSRNCWSVVRIKRHIEAEEEHRECRITYPDVAGWLYGAKMRNFTTACICVQQLAICTVFLSFVGANFQAVFKATFGKIVSHVAVLTMALPAVLLLSFLPSLKTLAPITALGTALITLAFALLAVVVVMEWPNRHEGKESETDDTAHDWRTVPLALCAILYSFEGICLILPVESSMLRPNQFSKVFVAAMAISASAFSMVAVFSVATFGNVTNGSITAFLLNQYAGSNTQIRGLLLAANAAVSLSVLVTYPLQLFPALELLNPLLSGSPTRRRRRAEGATADFRPLPDSPEADTHHSSSSNSGSTALVVASTVPPPSPSGTFSLTTTRDNSNGAENQRSDDFNGDDEHDYVPPPSVDSSSSSASPLTRVCLVLLTYVVAAVVPNVQALISLAGALAGSSTALLIPPALELAWLRTSTMSSSGAVGDPSPSATNYWKVCRCYLLLAGGFVFLVIGTCASLAEIVRTYSGR